MRQCQSNLSRIISEIYPLWVYNAVDIIVKSINNVFFLKLDISLMNRIFVTGGAGFIGSHSIDLLLQQGKEVVVLDNLSTGKLTNLNLFNPNLRFVQGDILDYSLLVKELARCDAVLHLAALSSVHQSIEQPVETLKVNTLGFLHLLEAIRRNPSPVRLVYASSAAVYGSAAPLPCSDEEDVSLVTLSPYALEKANNERYADLYARQFGVNSLGLRYFNVYGPRQDPKSTYSGVISKFIENYKNQQLITIFGDGQQSRDFIHVTDIARANVLALQSDYCGVLNIATGAPETLLSLLSYIEKIGGKSAEKVFAPPRVGDIQQSYAATNKADQHLDFRSAVSLAEGIRALL
jgi:UDP-glucose 4-epimerase